MKRLFLAVGILGATATLALADPPTFLTKTGSGSTSAEVIWPADPTTQPRVVTMIGTSDKAASVFSFKAGTTAIAVIGTTINATNIIVNSTNGFPTGSTIIIQTAGGVCTSATTHSVLSGTSTNLWITATNSTVPAVGDSIYVLGAATTIKCGAATTVYNGDAIFVGGRGRPIRCVLDGTSACSIDSGSVRYE